jgi:hypothetical protein
MVRDGALYAIVMAPPENGRVMLTRLAPHGLFDGSVGSVGPVGRDTALDWSQSPGGLEVHLPECPAGPGPSPSRSCPHTKGRWLRPRGAA